MKKTIISLLLALCLCLSCLILMACDKEPEEPVTDPNAPVQEQEIGKKGEVTLFPKEENEVNPNQPNEKVPDFTTRG